MVNVEFTSREREVLIKLVERAFVDTKVELRRTRNPEWREKLHEEEDLLENLLNRLREAEVPAQ